MQIDNLFTRIEHYSKKSAVRPRSVLAAELIFDKYTNERISLPYLINDVQHIPGTMLDFQTEGWWSARRKYSGRFFVLYDLMFELQADQAMFVLFGIK